MLVRSKTRFDKFGQRTSDLGVMALEYMPVNVMICRMPDFEIVYANPQSLATLRQVEDLLPVKAHEVVGQSIDIFHKHPERQRVLLQNPGNLPIKTTISLGAQKLDLHVSAIFAPDGAYVAALLTWMIATERVAYENKSHLNDQMLNNLPINVMLCDLDFNITYLNDTTKKTLKKIEHLLPISVDRLLGQSIDIFHKNPERVRKLMQVPENLPHKAIVQLDNENLELAINALRERDGTHTGYMLTWTLVTEQVKLAHEVKHLSSCLLETSQVLQKEVATVHENMDATVSRSTGVLAATDQLRCAIEDISQQINKAAEIGQVAASNTDLVRERIAVLSAEIGEIQGVLQLIADIASQTHLLALNANIEAARAGYAGKGFTVVANEVKKLAGQTNSATEQIEKRIAAIRSGSDEAVAHMAEMVQTVSRISEVTTTLSAAVVEQSAATENVNHNMADVVTNAQSVEKCSEIAAKAAIGVGQSAEDLVQEVEQFLKKFGL
jgi:methyl-accepting chemotaxis protein